MVEQLIQRLKSDDKDARSTAQKDLTAFARSGIATLEDAHTLIRATTQEFPAPEFEWQDAAASLLYAARDIARDQDPAKLIPAIAAVFDHLTPTAQAAALQVVVLSHTPAAADFYAAALEQHAAKLADQMIPQFEPAAGKQVANRLFPRLLTLARNPATAFVPLHSLLTFREAKLLPLTIAADHDPALAALARSQADHARRLQQPTGRGWRDAQPYAQHRALLSLLFDVGSVLEQGELFEAVIAAGDLLDPRLRMFRALAMLRHELPVPASELDWLAASPRDWYLLARKILDTPLEAVFPRDCLDQAKLAEGNLIDWLCFGTELGREPDEIGLIHIETRQPSEGHILTRWLKKKGEPVDYYFFKFRVTEDHWSREKGWMVGMAGGYPRAQQPTADHDGSTFSSFAPFDSKSIPEHVADYLG